MKKIIRILSRLFLNVPQDSSAAHDLRQKNMLAVLNGIATRPSQQRALPRFLRRSDRSSLRNRSYWWSSKAEGGTWPTASKRACISSGSWPKWSDDEAKWSGDELFYCGRRSYDLLSYWERIAYDLLSYWERIALTIVRWQRPSQRTFPCQLVDTTPWQSRSKVLYYNMTTERETGWLASNTSVER